MLDDNNEYPMKDTLEYKNLMSVLTKLYEAETKEAEDRLSNDLVIVLKSYVRKFKKKYNNKG